MNADIQVKWEDERLSYLSNEKQNTIDSSNQTFYTQHFPLGDRDNNGVLSGIDVYCYSLDASGTRNDIIATSLDDSVKGKFTLASAPSSDKTYYVTYYSSPVDMETPNALVNLAATQLVAALCFTRIDAKKVGSFRVGKVAVMKQSDAFNTYLRHYNNTINRIKQECFKVATGDKTV